MKIIGILFLFMLCFMVGNAQEDEEKKESKFEEKKIVSNDSSIWATKNPKVATLCSTVIPGLGQAYNKKYWKIPVIYVGFGAIAYFLNMNEKEYMRFRMAYIYRTDGDSLTVDEFNNTNASNEDIEGYREYYRRNRDLTIILMAALYMLNIIDANVDAHLFDYNIDDDLSLQWYPEIIPRGGLGSKNSFGVGLHLRF